MYTQLYSKTVYSLLKSCLDIEAYVKLAKAFNLHGIAITDEANVYGIIKFYQTCIKYNVKPLIGITVFLNSTPLILLAKTNDGYKNILKIATNIQVKQKISVNDLFHYKADLICIIDTRKENFQNNLANLTELFNLDLYLGIFPEITGSVINSNNRTLEISKQTHIEIVSLNEVRYLTKEAAETLRYLEAIDKGGKITPNEMQLFTTNNHLLEPDKYLAYFEAYQEAIINANKIADSCNVKLDFDHYHLPKFFTPKNVSSTDYLKALSIAGLEKRLQTKKIPNVYLERLIYELTVIEKMQFSDYFLIVYDYVKFAKNSGIYVGPGRGSSAGSLVSYVLGITNVDPLKYDLLFERFLNPERISLPDIDLDFQDDRRDEVIKYVQSKYGENHVAHIISFGTFQSRSAIREIGKVMDIKDFRINEILSYINSHMSITENIAAHIELKQIINEYKDLKSLLNIASKIENIPRNTSTHAAGIIICETDLRDLTGLQPGLNGVYQTQLEANDLETMGLIKMDFLGIRNLTAISEIIELIKNNHQFHIDINQIPLTDSKTYRLIARGETTGIFQLESKGMREVLKELNVQNFEDIVAVNALYRPGPKDNIALFIARKNKRQKLEYLHPDLIPILQNTYGIIVYQEQIMMIVQKIAGYSLGEADILRRAIGKKQKDIMENERVKFTAKAIENGYDKVTSETLYDYIVKFGDYGFNRSHSVAYALISYQMAYLKANYVLEFMAVMLSSVLGSESQTNKYLRDCKRYGIKILPLSINSSYNNYRIENNNSIRIALLVIKGIGPNSWESLLAERNNGLFKSYLDFVFRCHSFLKQHIFEALVYTGALDEFNLTKKAMIENYQKIVDFYRFNQSGYFTDKIELNINAAEYSDLELMKREKQLLGFYLTTHPVEKYRLLNPRIITPQQTFKYLNKTVEVVCFVESIRKIITKNNAEMATLTVSDEIVSVNGVIFPDTYSRIKTKLCNECLVKVKCRINLRNEAVQLIINDIEKI